MYLDNKTLRSNSSQGVLPPGLQGNSTVRAFLNGYLPGQGDSSTAAVAKAAILFHRAAHLTGQWSPSA